MTYKSGDIVRLKSGGPKMTILGTDNDDSLFICKWFDRNGKLHSDSFPQDMIEIFTPRPRDNTPAQAKPSYNKPFQHKPFEG